MRRFPAPWTVEAIAGGFKIVDANKQSIAYVYGHADPRDAGTANALTLDEARRIAAKSPNCPVFLPRKRVGMRMFDALSDCDRIALAKRKMERVLDHVINLAAIHENNAIVVFSPMLVDQIPRSYAAHAFNVFQHVMHDFEMVRLCALWDSPQNAEDETESIPTVVAIIDDPSVIDALVQTERDHWGRQLLAIWPR